MLHIIFHVIFQVLNFYIRDLFQIFYAKLNAVAAAGEAVARVILDEM